MYIRLLWQKFALFARTLGGSMHSGTKLFCMLNSYSVHMARVNKSSLNVIAHWGNLLSLMLASDFQLSRQLSCTSGLSQQHEPEYTIAFNPIFHQAEFWTRSGIFLCFAHMQICTKAKRQLKIALRVQNSAQW